MLPSTQVSPPRASGLRTRIRLCLAIVMAGLLLSGITAFPLIRETGWLLRELSSTAHFGPGTSLFDWIARVHQALISTSLTAPFLAYGTDWLALAHILLAILFLGPYRDPVRNQWVINFGLISCIGVLLLAFVAGPLRGIPLFWRWVDASFAIGCGLPLLLCRHYLHILIRIAATTESRRLRKVRRLKLRRSSRGRRTLP